MGDQKSGPGDNCSDMASCGSDFFRTNLAGAAQAPSAADLQCRRAELPHLRPGPDPYIRGGLELYLVLRSLYCYDR